MVTTQTITEPMTLIGESADVRLLTGSDADLRPIAQLSAPALPLRVDPPTAAHPYQIVNFASPFGSGMQIRITQGFGVADHGDDNVTPGFLWFSDDIVPKDINAPVLAAAKGVVVYVQTNCAPGEKGASGFGNLVTVRYDGLGADNKGTPVHESFYVTYMHLDQARLIALHLQAGMSVTPGQTIGYIGDAGYDGLHLHVQFGVVTVQSASSHDTIADASWETNSHYGMPAVLLAKADDFLRGTPGVDIMSGGDGRDTVSGGKGADILSGGSGPDHVTGGAGDDLLFRDDVTVDSGGYGWSDVHDGSSDVLDGGDGYDKAFIGDFLQTGDISFDNSHLGKNTIFVDGVANGSVANVEALWWTGGSGDDSVRGGVGENNLHGGDGRDTLTGGSATDYLEGGLGNDRLDGGKGNDWITGNEGVDLLIGGAGSDTFVFGAGSDRDGIKDFSHAQHDIILLEVSGVNDFGDLVISSDPNGNAVVEWAGVNNPGVTLYGVSAASLSTEDFRFESSFDAATSSEPVNHTSADVMSV